MAAGGVNAGNCISAPCATSQYALNQMLRVDAMNYNVTLQVAPGYMGGPINKTAPIVGAQSVTLRCGDGTVPGACDTYGPGAAMSFQDSQPITVAGFHVQAWNGGSSGVSIGPYTSVNFINMGWGYVQGDHILSAGGAVNESGAPYIDGDYRWHFHCYNYAQCAVNGASAQAPITYTFQAGTTGTPTQRNGFIGVAAASFEMSFVQFNGAPNLSGGSLQYACHGNGYLRISTINAIPGANVAPTTCVVE